MKILLLVVLALFAMPAWSATCKISEYESLIVDNNGRWVPVAQEPAILVQNVTYTTSTQSTAFNSRTRFVRIVCDAKAHFEFGTSPSATASDPYLSADTPEYFGVTRGSSLEVAFYDGTS